MARLPLRGPRRIEPRGRFTLPKEVRERLGIPEGQSAYLDVELVKGAVVLRLAEWTPRRK